jgi:glycine betaine/proline transport system substrate-binding protein
MRRGNFSRKKSARFGPLEPLDPEMQSSNDHRRGERSPEVHKGNTSMLKKIVAALLCASAVVVMSPGARAADQESCKQVRIAAGDWPDIQITSAMMAIILQNLGYEPDVKTVAVPVAFASMKDKDIDLWMGNWMPSQTAELQPYLDDKSVEVIGTNLTGAMSSIAVPKYVADAGVKAFSDLPANKDKFGGNIYGFEAGNDVNRHVQELIADPKNHLEGWQVVESSEAGMVTEAEKAMSHHEWIVFVPYTPHAIMGKMDLWFLTGIPDNSFGEATVYTNVRAHYLTECPNSGLFFKNVKFSVPMLNDVLDAQAKANSKPEVTAMTWLKTHTSEIKPWLAGVKSWDGKDAYEVVSAGIATQ